MKARSYDKRIEVWEISTVADGFGGSTVATQKIASSWAKLQTEGLGRKAHNMGLVEFNDPLLFLVRGRNDLPYNGRTLFLMYRNQKYIIQAIKNEDLRDVDTEIFCTKEEPVTIEPIGVIE
jgi:head-tail adaptor